MKWQHSFRHLDPSSALEQYVEETFEKCSHLLLKESSWHAYYTKGKHAEHSIEVTVQNGTGFFKASGQGHSFHEAVDECAEKLSKQFQKKKEKLKSHKVA